MARLLYFGKLADVTGLQAEDRALPENISDTSALRAWLDAELKADGALLDPTVRIAINNQLVPEPATLGNTDEIAFMPPVGGG